MSSFWNYPLKFRAMPDPRIDELIRLNLALSQTLENFIVVNEDEITELKGHVSEIRDGIAAIQARLDAALASSSAGGTVDPAQSAEIHAVNADLKAIVSAMALGSTAATAPAPVPAPMPVPDPVPVPVPAPMPAPAPAPAAPDPLPASLTP